MATLTVASLSTTETDIAKTGSNYQAISSADQFLFPSSGACVLLLDAGTTGATITIHSQVNCDQGVEHDITVTLSANEKAAVKIPPRCRDANGYVQMEATATTDIEACPLRV